MKGSTYKRCGCKDAAGKPLGTDCPRLKGRSHGTWYYYAELPATDGGPRRRQRRGGFATQRDAQAALVDVLDRVQKRTHVEVGRQSVGEYLDAWMGGKAGLRSSTRRSYAEHIRLYLKPALGHHRLADLATSDVEDLYDALRRLGRDDGDITPSLTTARLLECRLTPATALSAARVRRVHATLMSALNSAAKRRLIAFNPAAYVELESGRRPRAVVRTDDRVEAWRRTGPRPAVAVWTAQQAGAVPRPSDRAPAPRAVPLDRVSGLRRGEAIGLPLAGLDLDDGGVRITQQIVQIGW